MDGWLIIYNRITIIYKIQFQISNCVRKWMIIYKRT